jgi:hypothetical protein
VVGDRFAFDFDARWVPLLRIIWIREHNSWVYVDDQRLLVSFGPWSVSTPTSNVASAQVTGPYRAWRAIGPHLSLADRGLTFGTTTEGGVCIQFHEPVRGMEPTGLVRHPALTVTVAQRDELAGRLAQ